MKGALVLSLFVHGAILAALIWSQEVDLLFLKTKMRNLEEVGVIRVDLTYKPSFTPMMQGSEKKDLPPPIVNESPKEQDRPTVPTKTKKQKEPTKKSKETDNKQLKSILSKIRSQVSEDDRPIPKKDNFPMRKDGEKGARGTGGTATRAMSPAELALQTAMRRHFEFPNAAQFRKENANAFGYIEVKLSASGSQFVIVSLSLIRASGFTILDKSCEFAVRKAIREESFSSDVIRELTGKESLIRCEP